MLLLQLFPAPQATSTSEVGVRLRWTQADGWRKTEVSSLWTST